MAQKMMCGSARCLPLRGVFSQTMSTTWRRMSSVRGLTVPPETTTKPLEKTEVNPKENNQPIKFSTSKGSHRTWRVDRTMGSHFQRPWWKVLPVSVFMGVFMLWCAFREESEIDAILQKDLYEQLPGLLSDPEEEPPQEK